MIPTILFQAADASAIDNERLAIVFGFVTLGLGVAAFLSCRICLAWLKRLGFKDPVHAGWYASFYGYHLYYWWGFGIAVVSHLWVALVHTGLPQSGDLGAGIHWAILGLGLFAAISASSVFFSCRVLPRLVAMATRGKPWHNARYRVYSSYHAYFWVMAALLVAAHFAASYRHAGVWPG